MIRYKTINYTHKQLTAITNTLAEYYTKDKKDLKHKRGWLTPWHSINDGSALGFIFMVVYFRDNKKYFYTTSYTFDDCNHLLKKIEEETNEH